MVTKRYVVQCSKHGVESKEWAGRMVVVARPLTRKQKKHSGCPHCRKEQESAT